MNFQKKEEKAYAKTGEGLMSLENYKYFGRQNCKGSEWASYLGTVTLTTWKDLFYWKDVVQRAGI